MDRQMLKKSVLVALAIIGATMIGAMMSVTPVQAQNTAWRIDSQRSTARLFLASAKNPDGGVNVGVARSRGVIHEGAGASTASNFNFTIYPADKDATLSRQEQSGNNPDYTEIHFKSTSVVSVDTNDFRVMGDLTVTHVERIAATLTPNEAYAGAAYSPAVTESVTKPVVFQFHRVSPNGVRSGRDDKAEWSASSTTFAEDFPELMNAVSTTTWPTFVADERCTMPSTVGEDFSGSSCAGKTVEPTASADVRCEMPSMVGEDFSGEVCTETSPVRLPRNQVRMQLDLQVTRIDATNLARSGE
jgi:polyisoprenoid-binding protein YceI